MEFVIITGLSGAGKSQAKKVFEDIGYYCIDNLPPSLISDFINLCNNNIENIQKVAIVSDVRNKQFFNNLSNALERLDNKNFDYKILFLEAKIETLVNRYKETRRTHPLRPNGSIEKAIKEEIELLSGIKKRADFILKTDNFNLTDLKKSINKLFETNDLKNEINIILKSFGYKRGIPLDADYLFDVRFIPNPYYIEDLRHKTGDDLKVQEYVMSFEKSKVFYKKLIEIIKFSIEKCRENDRKQLVFGVGCTGGHHRSVTYINKLFEELSKDYINIKKIHRDIKK
ncbi:MAG: RNase adapter RapZ [Bacillota bacterium]